MKDLYIRFMAAVTPQSTEKLLNLFNSAYRDGITKFHLLLNSPGGSVAHGLAIYNFLKGSPIEVVTHNFGTVDSIGVIIYCAGDKRLAVPHARFLLHPVVANFVTGSVDEHTLRERMNGLEADQQNIAKVIAVTVGKEEGEILDQIHSRRTFNAQEAHDYKLVDMIETQLIPSGARLESIKESEAEGSYLPKPFIIPQAQLYAAPPDSNTNLYVKNNSFSKAF